MIRVLIAEDQAMVRGALAALLALEGDIEVVGEVSRGDEVAEAAADSGLTWRCSISRCREWTGSPPQAPSASDCRAAGS